MTQPQRLWYRYPRQCFSSSLEGEDDCVSLQGELYQLLEFSSLEQRKSQQDQVFYPHQELAGRFLYIWNRLLAFHGVGTGKTYVAFSATLKLLDYLSDNPAIAYLEGKIKKIDRVLFLFHSTDLKNSISGEFNSFAERMNLSPKIKERVRFKMISDLNNVQRKSASDLQKEYSNTFFVLDEVHNFRRTSGKTKKNYENLMHVFDNANNIKVLANTATPSVNSVTDIIYSVNTARPKEYQIDVSQEKEENNFVDQVSDRSPDSDFLDFFYNCISHYQPKIEGVTVVDQGEKIDPFNTVWLVQMGKEQEKIYNLLRRKKQSQVQVLRGFSNAIIPEIMGVTDQKELFKKHVYNKDTQQIRVSSEYQKMIINPQHRKDYMKKFDEMGEIVCQGEGISYVFQEIVNETGGVFHFAAVLEEAFGLINFGRYLSQVQILNKNTVKVERDLGRLIKEGKRFYVIISTTSPSKASEKKKLFRLLRHVQNKDGQFVSVIIMSPALKEGISLKNIKRVIIMDYAWHEAGIEQAFGRAYRRNGFDDVKKEGEVYELERYYPVAVTENDYELLMENRDEPEADQINIELNQEKRFRSVNLTALYDAFVKDKLNRQGERKMKMMAVDGLINEKINKNENLMDMSKEADYDMVDYELLDELSDIKKGSKRRTHDLIYSDDLISQAIELLKGKFQKSPQVEIDQFMKEANMNKLVFEKFLFMINRRKVFFEDGQKRIGFAQKSEGKLVWVRDLVHGPGFQEQDSASSFWYNQKVKSVEILPLQLDEDQEDDEEQFNLNQGEYKEQIEDLYEQKVDVIKFFEQIAERYFENEELTPAEELFLDERKSVWLILPEPLGDLEFAQYLVKNTSRGRKKEENKKLAQKKREETQGIVGDSVMVHAIQAGGIGGSYYNPNKIRSDGILSKVRLYKPGQGWETVYPGGKDKLKKRYASIYFECIVEDALSPVRNEVIANGLDKTRYFGQIVVFNNAFKILDLTDDLEVETILNPPPDPDDSDARKLSKGTVCSSSEQKKNIKLVIETYINNLDDPDYPDEDFRINFTYKNVTYRSVDQIRTSYPGVETVDSDLLTDEKIRLFAQIVQNTRRNFCLDLRELMEDNGFIFYT